LYDELCASGYTSSGDYIAFSINNSNKTLDLKDYAHDWDNMGNFFDAKKLKNGEIIVIAQPPSY
jgi:hypothetical protein